MMSHPARAPVEGMPGGGAVHAGLNGGEYGDPMAGVGYLPLDLPQRLNFAPYQHHHQHLGPGAWRTRITDCCDNSDSTCIQAYCCPWLLYGKIYAAASKPTVGVHPDLTAALHSSHACAACTCYLMSCCMYGSLWLNPCLGCMNRGLLRNRFGIGQDSCAAVCEDLCLHAFCWPCALTQEWRELVARKDEPLPIAVGAVVGRDGFLVLQQPPLSIRVMAPGARQIPAAGPQQQAMPPINAPGGYAQAPVASAPGGYGTVDAGTPLMHRASGPGGY